MPDLHTPMISWQRYGYRMIGSADERAALARARYLGAAAGPLLNLGPGNVAPAGGSFAGETYTPGPAIVPHTLTLHLNTAPPAPAIVPHILTLHLGPTAPVVPPALTVSLPPPPVPVSFTPDYAPAPPTIVATPACPTCTSPLLAGGLGAAGGALLMYFVGLSTRETKKRRRNRRR